MFWIYEEGVMRASRLMNKFETARKMSLVYLLNHLTNRTKLIFYHHINGVLTKKEKKDGKDVNTDEEDERTRSY